MDNHGIGNKFVSVNLNKFYGQPSNSSGTVRSRPIHAVGGGMVVLSRPKSLQKTGQKLSVPPPLNLPSLRKEHERFDSSGAGGGQAGGGNSGNGSRPNSSGMGWTKPSTVAFQEKDGVNVQLDVKMGGDTFGNGDSHSSVYMPPSARTGTFGFPVFSSDQGQNHLFRAPEVLRSEDFPSLQAVLTSTTGPIQKQKDGLQQKHKHALDSESHAEQKESSRSRSFSHTLHHFEPSDNNFVEDRVSENCDNLGREEKTGKNVGYFPAPLPIVHLNSRSDWADDERDTSHGIVDRGRDHEISKGDSYWDKYFNIPWSSVLPHKPNVSDRCAQQRDDKIEKVPYANDVRIPSREGLERNTWRSSHLQTDGFGSQEVPINRNVAEARHSVVRWETNKDTNGIWDTAFARRDMSYAQGGTKQWNHKTESHSIRGSERNTRYGNEQYNRHRGDEFQNSSSSKSSFSSGVNGLPINDPILNFGKVKRSVSKNEKVYLDDSFRDASGFDGRDPFSGDLVGIVMKKKDVPKSVDYHDPVRDSFEAELERVQKMQEQERQRIVEEQERTLELSRREEEERERLARKNKEMQRRLEEESREAAWRTEQEHLEAAQRAEDQRISREEEKRRFVLEEERRKQAAKQKLQELEAKIAKRQVEQTKGNEKGGLKEDYIGDWEDGERLVERITTSSSDSSNLRRVKPVSPWRRDVFENGGNSDLPIHGHARIHHSSHGNMSLGGREFPRKDLHGGGFIYSKNYYDGDGILDSHLDGFTHLNGQRWNLSGDGDQYGRNADNVSEFYGDFVGDGRWGPDGSRPYLYQQYQNSPEEDSVYSFGRPRYSTRQPRVLPPPSVVTIHKIPRRRDNDLSSPSTLIDNEMHYNRAARDEMEHHELSEIGDTHQRRPNHDMKKNTSPRCESQSSLSVSSPPISPVNPSHDDLDESAEGENVSFSGNQPDVLITEDCMVGDDEKWVIENNKELQEQEEYDEDLDGYQREDETHEGDNENVELTQEFDDLHLEKTDLAPVLGFNEGVEVRIPSDECDRSSQNEVYGQKIIDSSENLVKDFGSSGQTFVHPVASSASIQAELPMKLQFGLFSGPSLIPSPVPSIQIGSIQMPLHLHTQVSPNLSHMHLQRPLFQFGQRRCASSISQGNLSLSPQTVSYVQSNFSADFSLKPNSSGSSTIPNLGQSNTFQQNVLNGKNVLPATESGLNSMMSKSSPVVNNHVLGDQESDGHTQNEPSASTSFQRKRDLGASKAQGVVSGGKAKKLSNARSYRSRSSCIASEASSHSNFSGYQKRYRRNIPRTEFRIRETGDMRQSLGVTLPNQYGQNNNSNFSGSAPGKLTRSGSKNGPLLNRLPIHSYEPHGVCSEKIESGSKSVNDDSAEGHMKKIICSKEDDDGPLQSGVVRVCEQPGIEVPRDEDDFIEVKSKRQMLNDRREQRVKEIKSKSRAPKLLPKTHPTQNIIVSMSSNNLSGELASNVHSDMGVVSQPLAPIGTPPANPDGQADIIRSQTIKPGIVDNIQTTLGWGNGRPNQKVMPLTQCQIDDAMKPAQLEMYAGSIVQHSNSGSEPSMPLSSSPILSKDISLSSMTQSPINSLLAGEKIQFGAVTSPTILHSRNRSASRTDLQTVSIISSSQNNCTLLEDSCAQLEDSEAEAAASAVAAAAISSDEVADNGIGKQSLSVSVNKSIMDTNMDEMTRGLSGDQKASNQSRLDESLSMTLPADLSVDTPQISMWPPLPSPHNSPSHMVSHFSGGAPSRFPLYDMNPMLGGPIYAFRPHEEPSSTQSHPPMSSGSGSSLPAPWQHHSGLDSFCSHHASCNGLFINSPGVQGPPHMVVYNHFAPVGQFGQVGLSFMGTTYIPSGKQPDWKHNPTSSSMGGEVDLNSMNVVSAQRNPPSQHLAPSAPHLPMFDVSPFQGSPDMSVRARWPHMASFHPVPQPLQHQQPYSVLPYQFNHVDQELTVRGLPSDGSPVTQAPSEPSTKASLSSTPTPQNFNKSSQQKNSYNHNHSSGTYSNYQRSGEWSQRRAGFKERNQSAWPDKCISSSTRVKQVYVAKQTTT